MINDPTEAVVQPLVCWAAAKPFVRKLWLFGSWVKGNHNSNSDVDIAIEIDPINGDEGALASWVEHAQHWKAELQAVINWRYRPSMV